jgi:hypothetical protein
VKRAKFSAQAGATEFVEESPPLSPQRAFVVQFRTGVGVEQTRFSGRVEHMTTGQTTRFESVEELVTFVSRVLATVRD